MKKQLLIFAWEYDGYHSISGGALSRRIRQVAEDFEKNGWQAIVIHRDQRGECGHTPFVIKTEPSGVQRIVVRSVKNVSDYSRFTLLRKLRTFYYVAFHGDRSYKWANNVIKYFDKLGITRPDLIISFFTPRGPLFLGHHFGAKLHTPWIADLQDNFDHGISQVLIPENKRWTKKILTTAQAVVHVSTEWAETDGKLLELNIKTIRHAVPNATTKTDTVQHPDKPFTIFYGGSLSEQDQSLYVLKKAINDIDTFPRPVELLIAGTTPTFESFARVLGDAITVKNLGWLNKQDYNAQLAACDCSLVIPWSTPPRQVVPSKFYELCGYGKPIWMVGNDTGGFAYLLEEWKHPAIATTNIGFQQKALLAAINGNFSLMFNMQNCAQNYIKEDDLFKKYTELI